MLLFLAALFFFTACSKSVEEKANDIAKKALNSVIVNIDTYEPIENKIDSAFAPMMTSETFAALNKMINKAQLLLNAQEDAQLARMEMTIYEDQHSSYDKECYNRAKENYESANQTIADYMEQFAAYRAMMAEYSKETPVFSGYRIFHRCRFVNKEGDKTIGNFLILTNKDFTEVDGILDMDNEIIQILMEGQ